MQTDFIHGKQQKAKEILVISIQNILTEQKNWTTELRCAQEAISHTDLHRKHHFFRICLILKTGGVTRNQKKKSERHEKLKNQRKLRRLLENLQKMTNDLQENKKSRKGT